MDDNELKNWCEKLILRFRDKYNTLDECQRKNVDFFDNLTPPIQLNVFWFQNKAFNINLQILFFTKWDESEDLTIIVHGPTEFSKSAKFIEEVLNNNIWERPFLTKLTFEPPGTEIKYSTRLKSLFIEAFGNFRRYFASLFLILDSKSISLSKRYIQTMECFPWICYGNISNWDLNKMIDSMFKKSQENIHKPQKITEQNQKDIKGYGCYIYPPIWLGEPPKLSLEEEILGTSYHSHDKEQLTLIYKEKTLLIEKDGFIAIGEDNKQIAKDMLNEIMSIAHFFNLHFYIIRESDLGDVSIQQGNNKIVSSSFEGKTLRTELSEDRWKDLSQLTLMSRMKVSKKDIRKIVELAETVMTNNESSNLYTLYLEANTHFLNFEFSQSFIMSWILIENKILSVWEKFIDDQIINNTRSKKLKNRKFRTIDDKIEILNITNQLSNQDYKSYIKFKNIRNKIVHKGFKASKNEAKECLNVCTKILKEIIVNV